jgi:hypothetical protein
MVGYLAGIQVDPDAGIGAVVLQNGYGAGPVTLARRIERLVANARAGADASADARAGAGTGAGAGAVAVTGPAEGTGAAPAELAGTWRPVGGPADAALEIVAGPGGPAVRIAGATIDLAPWDEDRWLAPHELLDRHLLVVDRGPGGDEHAELWHGGERYVRAGAEPRPLPVADPAVAACAGTYRSHTPWTTCFRVVVRGERLWLTFADTPDGFEEEAPLVPLGDGTFRVGEDPGGPERLGFDTEIEGRPVRALLSGWPYERTE